MHCAQLLFPFYGGDLTKDGFVYDLIKNLISHNTLHPFSSQENLRRYLNGQRELSIKACYLISDNIDKNRFINFLASLDDDSIHLLRKSLRKWQIKTTKKNFKEIITNQFEQLLKERTLPKDKSASSLKNDLSKVLVSKENQASIKHFSDIFNIVSPKEVKNLFRIITTNLNCFQLLKSLDPKLQYNSHSIINNELHIFCETSKINGRKVRNKRIRKVKDIILNGLTVILNIVSRRYDPISDDPDSKYISDCYSFVLPFKRQTNRLNFLTQDG